MGGKNSKLPGNPPEEKARAQKTFEKFPELRDELAKQVFTALPINEQGALARTSKYYFRFLSQHVYTAKLLMLVAHGEQERAAHMLEKKPGLLVELADVTDYSGRTFKHITAYEYAYWAKDTHMCRMLERYMDANTATIMHQRCLDIEKHGLTYEQRGVVIKHSYHFDLTPLKSALEKYSTGYRHWFDIRDLNAIEAASMAVGMAQRDVPVHVANEYCRIGRSFHPTPAFNEETLPRNLKCYNYNTTREASWFPLVVSASSGLGVNFSVARGSSDMAGGGNGMPEEVGAERAEVDIAYAAKLCERVSMVLTFRGLAGPLDLEGVRSLDEVRTMDLTQSRANLKMISQEPRIGLPGM